MAKKKKPQKNSGRAKAPAKPEGDSRETVMLPKPLKTALRADYSQVLRMRNVQWLIVIAAIVGSLLLGYYLSAIFVPLLAAMAIAYILEPLVRKLQKKGLSRVKAVLLIFIAFIIISAGVGTWFVASIVSDVQSMSTQARGLIRDFQQNQDEWIASWNQNVPERFQVDPKEDVFGKAGNQIADSLFPSESQAEAPEAGMARAQMASARADLLAAFQAADANGDMALSAKEAGPEFSQMDRDDSGRVSSTEWFVYFGASKPSEDGRVMAGHTSDATSALISFAGSGLMGLLTLVLFVALVPIYTWYFMVGFDKVLAKGKEFLPGSHKDRIVRILSEIDAMLRAFFRGRIVIVVIITVLTTITYLAFGVKYAVLLGLLGGLGILIPYTAMLISWIPALILMGIDGDPLWAIITMSLCFHAIQALEQFVLAPKLLGDAVELHPVTILVGVFVMASLFGLFGALLAVPLTAIAKTLGREFILPYFRSLADEKPKPAKT